MQHMVFASKPYEESPQADVLFVEPSQLGQLPPRCFNLYIVETLSEQQLQAAISQLPDKALVVDYTPDSSVVSASLLPKYRLEQQVPEAWQKVLQFFTHQHLDIEHLAERMSRSEAVDEAIDVILNTSSQFLRVADDFLEILQLAQPLQNDNSLQRLYDLVALLQRRIYALTPGNLSQQFAQSFGGDDWIGHDVGHEKLALALAM
jgi:hypothetical protein